MQILRTFKKLFSITSHNIVFEKNPFFKENPQHLPKMRMLYSDDNRELREDAAKAGTDMFFPKSDNKFATFKVISTYVNTNSDKVLKPSVLQRDDVFVSSKIANPKESLTRQSTASSIDSFGDKNPSLSSSIASTPNDVTPFTPADIDGLASTNTLKRNNSGFPFPSMPLPLNI